MDITLHMIIIYAYLHRVIKYNHYTLHYRYTLPCHVSPIRTNRVIVINPNVRYLQIFCGRVYFAITESEWECSTHWFSDSMRSYSLKKRLQLQMPSIEKMTDRFKLSPHTRCAYAGLCATGCDSLWRVRCLFHYVSINN